MRFCPEKKQRYMCALRNFLQSRIMKNGYLEKYRCALKKIYLYEATAFSPDFTRGCDLRRLTDSLFGAAVLRLLSEGKVVSTFLCGRGEFYINVRLYEIALCIVFNHAENGSTVRFFATDHGVVISLSGGKKIRVSKNKLGAVTVYLLPDGDSAFFIPLMRKRGEISIKNETEYLFDRYSVLNVFLD